MSPNSERELLFREWMGQYRGILLRIARSFARIPADEADLEQEMMLRLWISIPEYERQAKASTWIYKVCLNTALTWRRGTSRRERRITQGEDLSLIAASGGDPADDVSKGDLLRKLYEAIREMPDSDRTLVLLMLDGLAYREISEVTGLTENHVGVALTRARRKLGEMMKGVSHELG
jgi:RNA polymerase sigma-70 factor (ECF subfamily)